MFQSIIKSFQKWQDNRSDKQDIGKLKRHYNLTPISEFDALPDFASYKHNIDTLIEKGSFEDFIDINNRALSTDTIFENGRKLYSMQRRYFLLQVEKIPHSKKLSFLEDYKRIKQPDIKPELAAVYASFHLDIAWKIRGEDYIGEVSDIDQDNIEEHLESSQVILSEVPEKSRDRLLWHWINYDLAILNGNAHANLENMFEKIWSFDRYDLGGCVMHANYLLPRWYGDSKQDLEKFACKAVEYTSDRFGEAMYAWIYGSLQDVGELEPQDLSCDRERIIRGYQDILERFPSQESINKYVATLIWFEKYDAAFDILDKHMRKIILECWCGDDEKEQEEDALDSLLIAAYEAGFV